MDTVKTKAPAKHHYRTIAKSDHLGVADLEEMIEKGIRLVFTIKEVRQEYGAKVAGKKMDANIAYFKEPNRKPLVLNTTNSKQIVKFTGSKFIEDWSNLFIELYIDPNVKMKGDVVGGIRIVPRLPQISKPELTQEHPRWDEAKKAILGGKKEGVLKMFSISPENILLIETPAA